MIDMWPGYGSNFRTEVKLHDGHVAWLHVCRKSMDSVDFVRLVYWNKGLWTMSTVHRQCPLSPWTMSIE